MPANKKPRKAYRQREKSIYPTLHDIGLIFRPIYRLFDQLREGEVDSQRGVPLFLDWQGRWCEVVPALNGWAGCWERVSDGEGLGVSTAAVRRLAKYLGNGVPMTEDIVEDAWREIQITQQATLRIPRKTMSSYMKTELIAIEVDKLGLADAA